MRSSIKHTEIEIISKQRNKKFALEAVGRQAMKINKAILWVQFIANKVEFFTVFITVLSETSSKF
jgi:hypothetical protein